MEGKKILIAEDDDGIYELVSSDLIDDGWLVDRAETGAGVFAFLQEQQPYLLILDYLLPDMDGQELIELAGQKGIALPPFIVSTGRGDENLAVLMMKLGARDYVVKDSFFLEHLNRAVKRLDTEISNKLMLDLTRKALGVSEALLFGIFNQAPLSILVLEPSGQATDANATFRKMRNLGEAEQLSHLNMLSGKACVESGLYWYIITAIL